MIKFAFIGLFTLVMSSAQAEYRVYQYYVRTKVEKLSNSPATLVTSTLDPKSYATYNGGGISLEVNLLRSWICYGYTAKKPPCTISEGKELTEGYVE